MIMSTIISVSFTLLTGLLTYFVTYQLHMQDQFFLVMLTMLGTIGVFLIPWQLVSKKLNKGPAYALGLGIACVAIIGAFFLPNHPTPLIYVVAFVAGLGFSAQYVFPWSMIPDVVEVDQARTGERHEGIYFGANSLLGKISGGLGCVHYGMGVEILWFLQRSDGAIRANAVRHPLLLCHCAGHCLPHRAAAAHLVPHHPPETCGVDRTENRMIFKITPESFSIPGVCSSYIIFCGNFDLFLVAP